MEGCGIVAPATNRAAESTYAKPRLARILWHPLFHRRRSISPTATTWAANGVRDSAGVGLQLTFERTESTGGSYGAAGARRSYYARRRCSGARSSPAMADGGFGRSRGSGYRARARERGEGKGRGAHGGLAEQASVLGDVLRAANRRRRWLEPEVEDDGDGDVPGPPGLRGSSRMKKTTWRSFWACRDCVGWPVAAAMANGGDGCARGSQGREGKREPKEGERSRGRGENEGRLWVSPWRRKDVGEASTAKQEVEAGARAGATHLPVLLAGGGRRPCP